MDRRSLVMKKPFAVSAVRILTRTMRLLVVGSLAGQLSMAVADEPKSQSGSNGAQPSSAMPAGGRLQQGGFGGGGFGGGGFSGGGGGAIRPWSMSGQTSPADRPVLITTQPMNDETKSQWKEDLNVMD